MPICPNCNYELVLLPRLKYKCALCSKLYLQKYIENKGFQSWNKKQREIDIHNHQMEDKEKLIKLKDLKRSIKQLFKSQCKKYNKEHTREYYQINKDKIRQRWKEYYHKNKEKLLEQDDKWREANPEKYSLTYKRWLVKNKDKRQEFLKAYRIKNQSLEKQKLRLAHLRRKQKALADQYLKNNNYKPSPIKFFPFSLTFSLCELLKQ